MGSWLGKKGKRLGKETVCYPESLIPEEEGSREAGYVTYKDGKYILKYSQYVSEHSKPRIGYHRDNKLYSFEDIVAYTCRLILHADLINSYAVEKGIAEEVCTQTYGRNWSKLLKDYAQVCHITEEELLRRVKRDAKDLARAGKFENLWAIEDKLKELLESGN